MFVITADQIGSRQGQDLAGVVVRQLNEHYADALSLPADRNAGDEIQALTADSGAAVSIVLLLTRSGQWRVGVGCGPVASPLPDETRAATGPAFFAAREAVESAKSEGARFRIAAAGSEGVSPSSKTEWPSAEDAQAFMDLLLILRAKRSGAGWELYDLLEAGLTQAQAAERLGVTPPAVSQRARSAELRAEREGVAAIVRLFHSLDEGATGGYQE